MSLNKKRADFTKKDFAAVAKGAGLKRGSDARILEKTIEIVSQWKRYAEDAGVDKEHSEKIYKQLRLKFE